MKYLKEMFSQSIPINISIENNDQEIVGTVSGIIHYNPEFLNNWLYKEKINQESIDKINNIVNYPVAILYNIYVEEDFMNLGYGNEGMYSFLSEAHEAKYIILIADIYEGNKFSLVKWYEKFGFKIIGETNSCPLMLLKNER